MNIHANARAVEPFLAALMQVPFYPFFARGGYQQPWPEHAFCELPECPTQDKKKERAAKGKEVAELKGEQLLGW